MKYPILSIVVLFVASIGLIALGGCAPPENDRRGDVSELIEDLDERVTADLAKAIADYEQSLEEDDNHFTNGKMSVITDEGFELPKSVIERALRSTSDNSVEVGDTAILARFSWITIQNPHGVEHGHGLQPFGDTCSVREGREIEAKAVEGNEVLVEYHLPYTAYGAPCGGGALFFVDRVDFLSVTEQYLATKKEVEDGKSRVERLLAQAN